MKCCPKCGKEYPEGTKFCHDCGKKLKIKKEGKPKKEKKEHSEHKVSPHLIPWIVFGVMVLITAGILLPTKIVPYESQYIDTEQYTADVPYEDVEEYTVQVPYEVGEQYVESIPVQEQEEYLDEVCTQKPLSYIKEWVTCSSSGFFSDGESTVKFTNTDSKSGVFSIKIGYNTNEGNFVGSTVSKTIYAGSSATFTYTPTSSSFDSCNYQIVSIPTKEVCELQKQYRTVTNYKDVIKTRTVTKYKDETKYRTVTKTRQEDREKEVRKTQTKYKEVNWLFGFDAIIKFRNLD